MIQQIKSSGMKKIFVKKNEDYVSEDNNLFTSDDEIYYSGVMGDIIQNLGYYGILLKEYSGNGVVFGHVNIDNIEDFKSYFVDNTPTEVEFEAFKNETETPIKKNKKKSEWKTVKILKEYIALKRYRIIKRLKIMKQLKTLRELETLKVLNPLKTLK